jgi:hypothetical protein
LCEPRHDLLVVQRARVEHRHRQIAVEEAVGEAVAPIGPEPQRRICCASNRRGDVDAG